MAKIWFSPSTCGFYREGVNASVPAGAIELTEEDVTALFDQQAAGKVIRPGPDGAPVATDPPAPGSDQLYANLRSRRDRLLSASDWTQMPDNALTGELRTAWASYRQALRDIPENTTDPAAAEWPAAPA